MGTFFVTRGVQAGGMRLSELDEVPLKERISQRVPACRRDVDGGDDVAVLDLKRGMYQLAIAISRWKEFFFSWDYHLASTGRNAAAINLSDIAAKRGTPQHLLVSLALAPDLEVG